MVGRPTASRCARRRSRSWSRTPTGREFSEDLSELIEPSTELGQLIGDRVTEAIGGTVESHGKAVLVGLDGEQEHGNAIKTTTWGNPFREAFGGGRAWLPSITKRCAAGPT